MKNNLVTKSLLLAALFSSTLLGQTTVVDFESGLSSGPLASGSFVNGGPTDSTAPLSVNGVGFNNSFTDFGGGFVGWNGWSFSSVSDSTTPGFGNQYAAFPGAGANASSNYAVGFQDEFNGVFPTIDFGAEVENVQVDITNTTYALFAIRDGNDGGAGFVRQFGDSDGVPGNDGVEDTFLLQIDGFDQSGAATGTVDFYLADYRFANNADDVVIDQWTNVDLSSLGQVGSLVFRLQTTDVSFGFSNTPNYFAADNLRFDAAAVPEPTSWSLCCLAVIAGFCRRRR